MYARVCFVATRLLAAPSPAQQPAPQPPFKLEAVMIPVRDGVRLQTVILTPVDQTEPLPILLRRTPYGVPSQPPPRLPPSIKELAQDGYIFVISCCAARRTEYPASRRRGCRRASRSSRRTAISS